MGIVYNEATDTRVVLREEHVFGRNPRCVNTHIDRPDISSLHAIVRWRRNTWSITDHSRNGTFVDGRALAKGEWFPLSSGQELRFGRASDGPWHVLDLSPPVTSLIPTDGASPPIPLTHNVLLPDASSPELSIYRDRGGQWVRESSSDASTLRDGDTVRVGDRDYVLAVMHPLLDTASASSAHQLRRPTLCFRVSIDEEHTQLSIVWNTRVVDLGERIHHYCLLTLARQRIADAQAGITDCEQGWITCTDLADRLGIDVHHLNILVFRARNQLMVSADDAPHLASIVERRRGAIRFGDVGFEVIRGGTTESQFRHTLRPQSAE